jgi:hypothetical protein
MPVTMTQAGGNTVACARGARREGRVDHEAEQRPAGERQADAPPPAEPVEVVQAAPMQQEREHQEGAAGEAQQGHVPGAEALAAPAAEAML